MAFVNNKSNGSNKINSSTKVAQIYNPSGEDASTLTMGFWNTYATLKINPALHPSKREANKVYDYDVSASVVLNAELMTTLHKALKLVEKDKKSIAVKSSQFMVKVGPCTDYEGMNGEYYLALFEVDKNEVQVGGLFFVFNQGSSDDDVALVGWNEQDGSVEEEYVLNTQWEMFKNFVELATETLVCGGSHGAYSQINVSTTKLTNAIDLLKSLVEMLVGGKSNSVSPSQSSGNYGSGFASQRKPRSFNSSSTAPVRGTGRMTSQQVTEEPAPNVGRRVNRNKVQEEVISSVSEIEDQLMGNSISLDDIDLDEM